MRGWWYRHDTLVSDPIHVGVKGRIQMFGPRQVHVIGKGATAENTRIGAVFRAGMKELQDAYEEEVEQCASVVARIVQRS